MNTAIKVLKNGRSHHGGTFEWPLPTQAADGTWTAGEWTPSVRPQWCKAGYHLTRRAACWFGGDGDMDGVVAYLTEYDGAIDGPNLGATYDPTKFSVERCRLLRPLTVAELEASGVYLSGVHAEISTGKVVISGSARVESVFGSARVERVSDNARVGSVSDNARVGSVSDNARVGSVSDNASVESVFGSARVGSVSDNASVESVFGSARVECVSDYARVGSVSDNASVECVSDYARVGSVSSNASVVATDQATVAAYGGRIHVGGQATCVVYAGTPCLTREGRAVIVDQRGDAPKTYRKIGGLDGWRYRDGEWVRVEIKAKKGAKGV